jgi:hypothetical protein
MIKIDDGYYYLDMDAINNWIFHNASDTGNVTSQTIMTSGEVDEKEGEGNEDDEDATQNDIAQLTIEENSPGDKYASIRNDIIKEMLLTMYNAGVETSEGNLTYIQNLDALNIGSKIIFNTFLQNGILKNKLKK